MIHTIKGFGIVNKAEIDVLLELSSFFDDPTDIGNLISGSSVINRDWSSELWCTQTGEYYAAMKDNENMLYAL